MRLNKFLAERLGISRRDADNLINSGRVKIDGVTAELGMQVLETQDILVEIKTLVFSNNYNFFMLIIPGGFVLSSSQHVITPLSTNYYPKSGKL